MNVCGFFVVVNLFGCIRTCEYVFSTVYTIQTSFSNCWLFFEHSQFAQSVNYAIYIYIL